MPWDVKEIFRRYWARESLSVKQRIKCLEEDAEEVKSGRCRLDDIEDDIEKLKEGFEIETKLNNRTFCELRERIEALEKGKEWTPKFGDRVRFKHPYFGEQRGICIKQYQDENWQILRLDPSKNNDTSFCCAKDMEKDDD